jgi:ABC-type transporter Mla subunit MlaD
MSSKPHYFAVGIFVLTACALGLVGIIAISSDALKSPKYFIETYVDESVQGIDIGTPFKFRGVKVGNVSEIRMVSEDYDTAKMYVMIRIAVESKTLLADPDTLAARIEKQVENGLRLKLVPQGITGLSFVEADFYPDSEVGPLVIDWEPRYAYIPSTPAMMTILSRSLERIAGEINRLNLAEIGSNVESISSNLNLLSEDLQEITRQASDSSGEIIENVRVASADLPVLTSNLTASAVKMEEMLSQSDRDIDQILVNLRYITDDTRELIRMIKRHPGILLREPPEKNLSLGGDE